MIISVMMMSAGSFMVAVLPPYGSIGIAAPVLLLVARLLQGLSVGAEYGTGATYISEIATRGRRGLLGSFQYFTIIAGQLLALLVVTALQQILTSEQLKAFGWRVPFIIGAISAIVVIYLRRSLTETSTDKDMHLEESGSVRGLLYRRKRAVAVVLAFTAGGSLYFYTFTTYMQKFLVVSAGMKAETVSFVMTAALVCFMLLQPIFGMLADRIGVRTSMLLFTGLAAVFVVPVLSALQKVTDPLMAFALVMVGFIIASFYTPVSGLVKADLFPRSVRALGVGLPYAIANASFGGTAEYVALWLRANGIETYYFYYVAAIVCFGFLASLIMPDLRKHGHLDGDGAIEENIRLRRR
jgi:MHS family alpha-ketoglutarate permease-like MFS transporter